MSETSCSGGVESTIDSVTITVEACYAAGLAALDNGDLEEARTWATRCATAPGGTTDARCAALEGTIASEAGEFDAAVSHFRRATTLDPQAVAIARQLGDVLVVTGALNDARVVVEEAARRAPEDTMLLVDLGYIRMMSGDRSGAREALERAVALQPANTAIRFSLAQIYEALGEVRLAAEALTQCQREAPSPRTLSELARLFMQLEHYVEAEAAFRTLQMIDPEHALVAQHGEIWCRIKQQDWRGAFERALGAIRLDRYDLTTALLAYTKDRLFSVEAQAEQRETELGERFMLEWHEHEELHSGDRMVGRMSAEDDRV